MSENLENAKTTLDWMIAIAPIAVSMVVVVIAFLQYRVNKYTLRLELYNRRFRIYEKAIAYFKDFSHSEKDAEPDKEVEREFVCAFREARFLFGKDSEVYEFLEELKDTLALKNNKKKAKDRDTITAFSEREKKYRDLNEIMSDLENALSPWLDFKNVERGFWRFR